MTCCRRMSGRTMRPTSRADATVTRPGNTTSPVAGLEGVGVILHFGFLEDSPVQQGHRDQGLHLQGLLASGAGQPGDYQTDHYGGVDVYEKDEAEGDQHHQGEAARDAVNVGDGSPVDVAPAVYDQDAGQNGEGDSLGHRRQDQR